MNEATRDSCMNCIKFFIDQTNNGEEASFASIIHELCDLTSGSGTECLKQLLEEYPQARKCVNVIVDTFTPLHRAVAKKDMEKIDILEQYGADFSIVAPKGNSVYHLAMADEATLSHLLNKLSNKQKEDIPETTAKVIYYAVFEKKIECLKLILNSKLSLFINTTIMGVTPLHIAAGEGNSLAVKELIDHGADITLGVQDDLITPLHVVSAKGNLDSLKLIMKSLDELIPKRRKEGEFITIDHFLTTTTKSTQMTPISFAAFRGHDKCLEYLLSRSVAALNMPSKSKMTPLHYATSEGHIECVRVLLKFKPNLFEEDIHGNNPYVYAAFKNRYECGLLLISHFNYFRVEYENSAEYRSKHFVCEKRRWLVLSLVDFEKPAIEIEVNGEASYSQLLDDLRKIKKLLISHCYEVSSKTLRWRKMPVIHIKFYDEVSKGTGLLRQYLYDSCITLINHSGYFHSLDNGRSYSFVYMKEFNDDIKRDIQLIGYFFALSVIINPVPLVLADYFFKHIVNEPLAPSDFIEPSLLSTYESLLNSSTDVDSMHLDFTTIVAGHKGVPETINLNFTDYSNTAKTITDCMVTEVTKSNIHEYVKKLIYAHTLGGHREEMLNAFRDGFYQLIPPPFLHLSEYNQKISQPVFPIHLFRYHEIKQMIGEFEYSTQDWREHTRYVGCDIETPQVKWFWAYVDCLDHYKRGKLLEFVTGSRLLPFGGFKLLKSDNQPFTVELSKESDCLPTSRTCFFTIVLPTSPDINSLHSALDYSLEHFKGFQFV